MEVGTLAPAASAVVYSAWCWKQPPLSHHSKQPGVLAQGRSGGQTHISRHLVTDLNSRDSTLTNGTLWNNNRVFIPIFRKYDWEALSSRVVSHKPKRPMSDGSSPAHADGSLAETAGSSRTVPDNWNICTQGRTPGAEGRGRGKHPPRAGRMVLGAGQVWAALRQQLYLPPGWGWYVLPREGWELDEAAGSPSVAAARSFPVWPTSQGLPHPFLLLCGSA